MRILVIDDDASTVHATSAHLTRGGYHVIGSTSAIEGLRLVGAWAPDLVILDIMMPDMDGRTLCEHIRRISPVPIIFLTGLGHELDIVRGLALGADEYLVKPVSGAVLVAYMEALLRRWRDAQAGQGHYSDGFLLIDVMAGRVEREGGPVILSRIESRLLARLVSSRGQVLSHRDLIEAAWPDDPARDPAILSVYVGYLRKKLEPDPRHPRYIRTQFGEGYCFEAQDSEAPPSAGSALDSNA